MIELAWRMWDQEANEVHYGDLVPFVEQLVADKVVEFDDEEIEDIAREMQVATFLKRDDKGNFSFVDRSFMEYFLARKIYRNVQHAEPNETKCDFLNTRRFDRKIIYFMSLLNADTGCLQNCKGF